MPVDHAPNIGATVISPDTVHFRVWAPRRQRVEVVLENMSGSPEFALKRDQEGFFSADVKAAVGARYRYRLDGSSYLYPDPASRFQPEGPHGPSEVVDPITFRWTDDSLRGVGLEGQVIYEMHLGTFTKEGTWNAAAEQLAELAALGVTVVEVMPIADFPGTFGWGYDGVCLYAPARIYGSPDDARRFVDRAHAAGIGVILDVVYNHIGPDGNYFKEFAQDYFTDRYKNEWGEAINFDGPNSGPVREFFIGNAGYWIDEFHMDGLRLDATQQIFDASPDNVMTASVAALQKAGKARRSLSRKTQSESRLVCKPDQGVAPDALWNDDFHHKRHGGADR